MIADEGVDFLDAEEVAGLRIGLSFDGDGEFVVAA